MIATAARIPGCAPLLTAQTAVNAGIMWIAYVFVRQDILPAPGEGTPSYQPGRWLEDAQNPLPIYAVRDFWGWGSISLTLTVANIFMIWLSGMLMFRIKEKMPIRNKSVFWEDLGVARKIYQHKVISLFLVNQAIPNEPNEGLIDHEPVIESTDGVEVVPVALDDV